MSHLYEWRSTAHQRLSSRQSILKCVGKQPGDVRSDNQENKAVKPYRHCVLYWEVHLLIQKFRVCIYPRRIDDKIGSHRYHSSSDHNARIESGHDLTVPAQELRVV